MKNIIKKTVPFVTAAALLAVPAYQTAAFFMTDTVCAEYTAEVGEEIIIELGEVTGEAGTKVKLPVYAKNVGIGLSALQFDYEMESSFKVTRGLKGDFACTWTIGSSERTVQFLEADGMNVSDGKIGRLEIDIPAGTPDGVYEISGFNFEGSRVSDNNIQVKLVDSDFTAVSGKIIIGSGESGNNDPEPSPSPSPSPEASPSNEAAPSPSAASSPSVKPTASAKTSPSAKASPSAKTSTSPDTKTTSSTKSSSSPEQNASSDPDTANTAVPAASDDPTAENSASPVGNNAAVSDEDGAVQTEVIVVTDAEGNEVTQIVTESKANEASPEETQKAESPLSKKVRTGVLIGSVIAILLVLLLVFKRD